MPPCMSYRFCVIKNNGYNVRRTNEGEKSNKYYAKNHTVLFVCLREIAQEYLFRSYQSLHSSKSSLSEGNILNGSANVIYICTFSEEKSANCVELKERNKNN